LFGFAALGYHTGGKQKLFIFAIPISNSKAKLFIILHPRVVVLVLLSLQVGCMPCWHFAAQ
jgi:hypothetical protein